MGVVNGERWSAVMDGGGFDCSRSVMVVGGGGGWWWLTVCVM